MDKIWRKVGRQDHLMKESSQSSKSKFSSNNLFKKQSRSNSEAPIPSNQAYPVKNKHDSSSYFNISEDSFLNNHEKKLKFEEESKGKQSVNIQFEKQSDSYNHKQNSQIVVQKKRIQDSFHSSIMEESNISQQNDRKNQSSSQIVTKNNRASSEVSPRNYKMTESEVNFKQPSKPISDDSFFEKAIFMETQNKSESRIKQKIYREVQIVQPGSGIQFDSKIISVNSSMIKSSIMVDSDVQKSKESNKSKEFFGIKRKKTVEPQMTEKNVSMSDCLSDQKMDQKNSFLSSKKSLKQQPHQNSIEQEQDLGRKSQAQQSSISEVEVIEFNNPRSEETNLELKELKEKQKQQREQKKGIMVRIKSGSRLKESLFFEVDSNMNKSDSYLQKMKRQNQQEQVKQKNLKTSLPEFPELNKINLLENNIIEGHESSVTKLLKARQISKQNENQQYNNYKEIKANGLFSQEAQVTEEQEVQEVIDLENQYFQPFYHQRHDNQLKNYDERKGQMLQESLNNRLYKSHNQETDSNIFSSNCRKMSQNLSEKQKRRKKINLGGLKWSNNSLDFDPHINQTQSKNQDYQQSQQIEFQQTEAFHLLNKKAKSDCLQDYNQRQNNNTDEYSLFGSHRNQTEGSQIRLQGSTNMGKSYLALDNIEPIEQSKQEEQNCPESSLSQAHSPKYQQEIISQTNPRNSIIQKSKNQPQFSYRNFMNILDENIQLKSQLMEYAKQTQSKDQQIHELTLEKQKIQTDCQALRDQIEHVQHEKEELMLQKQINVHNSELAKIHSDMEAKDLLITRITQENASLKDKIYILNAQIHLLTNQIKEKLLKSNQALINQVNSGSRLTASKREYSHMTGYFNQNTSLNGLTQTLNKKCENLNPIPTLTQQNNFGSSIRLSQDGSNADFMNISIMLNIPKSKRLVMNGVQAFAQLQEYVFDLEQKIIISELQLGEKIQKFVQFNELKLKQKFSRQIQDIQNELYVMKVKYDKLKLWVKKYQKEMNSKKQINQTKQPQLQTKEKNQEKSTFEQMIKNVTDFQQLFMLFNQFNQMQNQAQNQNRNQNLLVQPRKQTKDEYNNKNRECSSLIDTQVLRQKEMILKVKEEEFERMTRQIQNQWEQVQKQKSRCVSPESHRNMPHYQQNPSFNSNINKVLMPQHPNYQNAQNTYYNSVSSPFINQNQNYHSLQDNKRINFNKFSSQVQRIQQFESSPKIEDSRSERNIPLSSNYNFLRFKSPKTDKILNSEFDFNHNERGVKTFMRSRSPDFQEQKRRLQFEQPSLHRYEYRKTSKVFQDPKDISFISSKLSKLRNDIDMELKSIK